jgi:hypothetical protein
MVPSSWDGPSSEPVSGSKPNAMARNVTYHRDRAALPRRTPLHRDGPPRASGGESVDLVWDHTDDQTDHVVGLRRRLLR